MSEAADVLGRHCSNIAPAPIISSGPSLQIRFVSDYAHQGAGFSLRYEIFKTGEGIESSKLNLNISEGSQGSYWKKFQHILVTIKTKVLRSVKGTEIEINV